MNLKSDVLIATLICIGILYKKNIVPNNNEIFHVKKIALIRFSPVQNGRTNNEDTAIINSMTIMGINIR